MVHLHRHNFAPRQRISLREFRLWGKRNIPADPEWLISTGRVVSALFAALAIYLDPTRPARSLNEAHLVLGAYVVFSICVALYPPRRPSGAAIHLVTHGVDVLALAVLVYLTDELESPFFPLVPFILLATTLRWGMRGAVFGALVMEVMMLAVGWQDLMDGESELNVVIMRSAYFLVAAAMLGYFGAYRARNSHRFAQLASWSLTPVNADMRAWLEDMLDHASELLGAQRFLLIWRDQKSLDGMVAQRGPQGLELTEIRDPLFWQARTASLTHRELSPRNEIAELHAIAAATGLDDFAAAPFELRSACFAGSRNVGRLYVLDARYQHEDAVALTQITALRIGHELERLAFVHAIANNARDQERVRLARDLHDSVLQDLTAATLKLKATGATMPENVRQALDSVNMLMTEQQRRIRMFVEKSRIVEVTPSQMLSSSLSQSANDLCGQWGCDIALTVTPPDIEAPGPVHRELAQLLCEATANAVRHGGATRLTVDLMHIGQALRLNISDNGCGMTIPHDGRPQLPRSLHARVEDLNGNLAITRYAPGLAMMIEVPLP